MTARCLPSVLSGKINAISSKSDAHRLLICAALAGEQTKIRCNVMSKDIAATVDCLKAMGTNIVVDECIITVTPAPFKKSAELDCSESGSTLRFLLPVIAALGIDAVISGHGRLPERPLSPLKEEMEKNGTVFRTGSKFPLHISGQLTAGDYELAGNVSSQFISGLLFALPLLDGDSKIKLIPPVESRSYIKITLAALKKFGIEITEKENLFIIKGNQKYRSPKEMTVDGDWSNSAFFLCAGALGGDGVTVTGLDINSPQGDKKILDVLKNIGANIAVNGDEVTVKANKLSGVTVDASDIPDLVPVISVMAALSSGETQIKNAGRLRIKECDRLAAVYDMLTTVGISVTQTDDGLIIEGGKPMGGKVNGCNDHRMVMSAAVLSLFCREPVNVTDAQAVDKSYPNFFKDFNSLGGNASVIDNGK